MASLLFKKSLQVAEIVTYSSLLLVKLKTKTNKHMQNIDSNTYQFNVQIPTQRIRKHKKIKVYHTNSELGNKILNCPIGGSFAISNHSERSNVPAWGRKFGMKFTVRNTSTDVFKRAFRIA